VTVTKGHLLCLQTAYAQLLVWLVVRRTHDAELASRSNLLSTRLTTPGLEVIQQQVPTAGPVPNRSRTGV
jgi:hypothetical protein